MAVDESASRVFGEGLSHPQPREGELDGGHDGAESLGGVGRDLVKGRGIGVPVLVGGHWFWLVVGSVVVALGMRA